jgi:hypothetical protein
MYYFCKKIIYNAIWDGVLVIYLYSHNLRSDIFKLFEQKNSKSGF